MTDDTPIPGTRLAEALAEIERLRARIIELEAEQANKDKWMTGSEFAQYAKDLHDLVVKLEAEHAITHGTLAQPTPDEATTIVHDVKPSAPPHNE